METFTRAEECAKPGYFASEEQKHRDGSDTDIEVEAVKGKELWKQNYKLGSRRISERSNASMICNVAHLHSSSSLDTLPFCALVFILSLGQVFDGDYKNVYIELVTYNFDNARYF